MTVLEDFLQISKITDSAKVKVKARRVRGDERRGNSTSWPEQNTAANEFKNDSSRTTWKLSFLTMATSSITIVSSIYNCKFRMKADTAKLDSVRDYSGFIRCVGDDLTESGSRLQKANGYLLGRLND